MKRWLGMVALFAAILGVVVTSASRGQFPQPKPGDFGPGTGGAILKQPGLDPNPPMPQLPSYIPKGPPPMGVGSPASNPSGGAKVALPPSNATDINKDIEITPEAGPWAVFVMSYSGPKAPEMARKFVTEMRNTYKLPAYVFNKGAEEKRKEYERVQKKRQEQLDALQKAGLKADVPIRVAAMRIEEQTAVLIGGFKTFEQAAAAATKIRDLRAPDPTRVDLDTKFVGSEVEMNPLAKGKTVIGKGEHVYVNPFKKALPVRNPTIQMETNPENLADEIRFLRRINSDEPLSLFNCKKPVTLAVKQFKTQFRTTGDDKEAKGILAVLNGSKGYNDVTAQNAHNLAEAFRKAGLPDTYVLHCKYCSYVTVGGYDSEKDERLIAMQNFLQSRFATDAYRQLDMIPRPVPMQVPQ